MLGGHISIYNQLSLRSDINNQDIQDIIAVAEKLQQQAIRDRENRTSEAELRRLTRELDISDEYVKQAIQQIRSERKGMNSHHSGRRLSSREMLLGGIVVLALVIVLVIVLRDSPEKIEVTVNTENNVQVSQPQKALGQQPVNVVPEKTDEPKIKSTPKPKTAPKVEPKVASKKPIVTEPPNAQTVNNQQNDIDLLAV